MTQLRPAKEADRELLRNMFNLMHAELAPFTRELHSVDERGYFEPAAADAYLAGEDCARAHVILEEGRTAGIVAMTAAPYAKPGCDYCLQEVYVLAPHARAGRSECGVSGIAERVSGAMVLHRADQQCARAEVLSGRADCAGQAHRQRTIG